MDPHFQIAKSWESGNDLCESVVTLSELDALGSLNNIGCIGGFRITNRLVGGDLETNEVVVDRMRFGWHKTRIVLCDDPPPSECLAGFNDGGILDIFDVDDGVLPPGRSLPARPERGLEPRRLDRSRAVHR